MCVWFVDAGGGRLQQLRLRPGGGALRQPVLLLPVHVVSARRQHGRRRSVHADLPAAAAAAGARHHGRCASRDLRVRHYRNAVVANTS